MAHARVRTQMITTYSLLYYITAIRGERCAYQAPFEYYLVTRYLSSLEEQTLRGFYYLKGNPEIVKCVRRTYILTSALGSPLLIFVTSLAFGPA